MSAAAEQLTIEVARALPPKWDGCLVEWDALTTPPAIFVCGPRRGRGTLDASDRCPSCGSAETRLQAVGLLHPHPGDSVAGEYLRRHRNGKPVYAQEPASPLRMLVAFRCPVCFADDVLDRRDGSWWTLDDSDYGPEGSIAA